MQNISAESAIHIGSLSRAFSASLSEIHRFPGALPQGQAEVAPLAQIAERY